VNIKNSRGLFVPNFLIAQRKCCQNDQVPEIIRSENFLEK
jgi:hypothetical protein